jgi:hypothetical protein
LVSDGRQRARKALAPVIRAQVEREFAERLRTASLLRRMLLLLEVEREIERRLGDRAPQEGLY